MAPPQAYAETPDPGVYAAFWVSIASSHICRTSDTNRPAWLAVEQ